MSTVISEFFTNYWQFILLFVGMSLGIFALLRLQVMLRDTMASTIQNLLHQNPALCLERLENNGRLKLLYRKPILLLWKLDCYMALGEDGKACHTIKTLRGMKLEPLDKVELYQKEISFYATSGDGESARKSCNDLKAFLKEAGAQNEKHYAAILSEAELIIGVYVDHNVSLIKKLTGRAEHTRNDVMRGISQYRVAKLAWFKGDEELMHTYLGRAAKNLKGTKYEPIIEAAMKDPRILETK